MDGLVELQQKQGARFVERDGVSLPRAYGDPASEFDALYFSAGAIDLGHFGVLRVEGPDRIEWLHKLVTADLQSLAEGSAAYALLLDATGHVAADFTVLHLKESLLLYTSRSAHSVLLANLNRAIFRAKVALSDASDALAALTLQGGEAASIFTQTLGTALTPGPSRFVSAKFFDSELLVVNSARTEAGGFDLLVERRHLAILWELLGIKGAKPVGLDALNAARIQAGIPWFGEDFDASILAPEARLEPFIAENKGCYTGQETMARIRNRGHVNRLLVRFQVQGQTVPSRGDLALIDGQEVGWITSAAWSPPREAPLAFGYIRREQAGEGTRVLIGHGDESLEAVLVP